MAEPKSESSEDERTKQNLVLLEAALYVAGRPLDVGTLGSVIRTRSKRKVQALTRMLVEEYSKREGALELLELDDGRFVLQLRSEYVPRVRRLAMRPLLTPGPLKTLAYIAYRQPVAQAHVVSVRGSHAYGHIQVLKRLGLITTEKLGRTKIIRTTDVFADYFNLSHDARLMRRQLAALFKVLGKPEEPPAL